MFKANAIQLLYYTVGIETTQYCRNAKLFINMNRFSFDLKFQKTVDKQMPGVVTNKLYKRKCHEFERQSLQLWLL